MKAAVIIVSRNRPDRVHDLFEALDRVLIPHDRIVVEAGTDPGLLTPWTSVWYPDPDFRGKIFAASMGVSYAQKQRPYDALWVLMNDVVLPPTGDPLAPLMDTLRRNPQLGALAMAEAGSAFPGARPRAGAGWRAVDAYDTLGVLFNPAALEEVGFWATHFTHTLGAGIEHAARLYRAGWGAAVSDAVVCEHLVGTTYGAPHTETCARVEHQRLGKRYAFDWFRTQFGVDWDTRFWEETAGFGVLQNTCRLHKQFWATAFRLDELNARGMRGPVLAPASAAPAPTGPRVQLQLGGLPRHRDHWEHLPGPTGAGQDGTLSLVGVPPESVDAIDVPEGFASLPPGQARATLRVWARLLKPGGALSFTLPDLETSARTLGRYTDAQGRDLATLSLYGNPDLDRPAPRWGWTRDALEAAVEEAGFTQVLFGPPLRGVEETPGRQLRVQARRAERAVVPWPLAASTPRKVLAWPRYDDSAELDTLIRDFASSLGDRGDVTLCLRRDPSIDPDAAACAARLESALARLDFGMMPPIHVVDSPMSHEDWERLGRAVECAVALPSAQEDDDRSAFLRAVSAPVLRSATELAALYRHDDDDRSA